MGYNRFKILAIPEALKNHIECFLLHELNGQERMTINVVPSGMPGIVFHHQNGKPAIESINLQNGRTISPPTLFLHGPGIESSVMNFGSGSYSIIHMILKPHALKALFGINALILNENPVKLNEFSNDGIDQQLMDAHCAKDQADLLTNFLIANLKQAKAEDHLVEQSLRLIHENVGATTVKALLSYFNISERQFERRFSQTVGVSPSSYIRVRRFNEAFRLMQTRQYNTLTEIAHALNFHDQSHFIRDIKAFTGITPKNLSYKAGDFYQSPLNNS